MTQTQDRVLSRSEIAAVDTWNAPSVFADSAAWEAEYQALAAALPSLQRFQGHLGESAALLFEALEASNQAQVRAGKLIMYAVMMSSADAGDQAAAALQGQATSLMGNAMATLSFIRPEILAIGEATLNQWLTQEPRLADYRQFLDDLFRQQAHVRSAEIEEVLGMVADPFASAQTSTNVLTNAEMPFRPAKNSAGEEVSLAQGNVGVLVSSPDREVRRTAWESYADGHLALKNTLATNLGAAIKQDVFFARARRHTSALEASLFDSHIPVAVFHNLINTFKANLPTWHRYWAIRRRALGVETLHPYDVHNALTTKEPQVSFDEAVAWISEGLQPLGDEYVSTLRRGCLEQRWVDRYPNQGKISGAFSYGMPGTYPFIMMNFANNLASMSTLAHELGHSMHSYLAWQTQPLANCNYTLFVAEVASNFNQAMVRAHLFQRESDPDFQIALLDEAMHNFHRYFFIMPTLARFELTLHERVERGESLSADYMTGLLADLFSEGYGSEVVIDREREGITWAQFSHLYANFYVYQYATGISAAHALSDRILSGEAGAADDYLRFLRAGNSLYPLDALKVAGVDMTTPAAVEKTFAVLAGMVDRLDSLTANR